MSHAELLEQGTLAALVAKGSIIVAISTNALFKWVLAWVNGKRQVAFWLGGGLLTMMATAFVLLYATR